jgi:predicted DNA-binding transcriptional regulator AlpA
MDGNNIMDTNQLLERLDISRSTLYRLIDRGLPQIKVSHKVVRYDFSDVLTWLKSNK